MSLFNTRYPNTIGIRAGEAYFQELYTINPSTEKMERVYPNGGPSPGPDPDPTPLPYWVNPDGADLRSGDQEAHLQGSHLEFNDSITNTGSLLNNSTLTFGDSTGNSTLTKTDVDTVTQLTARTHKSTPVSGDRYLIWDNTAQKYGVSPVYPYLKTSSIVYTDNTANVYNSYFGSKLFKMFPTVGTGDTAYMDNGQLMFGTNGNANGMINNTTNYTLLNSRIMACYEGTTPAFANLNYKGLYITTADQKVHSLRSDNLSDLEKLYAKTSMPTPTADEKMLLYNPTTEAYSYSAIPSGSGATLPSYLGTDTINMISSSDLLATNVASGELTVGRSYDNGGLVYIDPSAITVGSKTGSSFVPDSSQKRCSIGNDSVNVFSNTTERTSLVSDGLQFYISGVASDTLTLPKLNDLTSLSNKTSMATPTTSEKMLMYNPTSKAYSYSDIPSGSSVTLPTYLNTNSITMTASDNQGTITIDPSTVNTSVIKVSDKGATGAQYCNLLSTGLKFHPTTPSLANDVDFTIHAARRAVRLNEAVENTAPTTDDKMLMYNTTASTYSYTDLPLKKAMKVTLNKGSNPDIPPLLTIGNGFSSATVGGSLPLRFYTLTPRDELILIVDDSLPYDTWIGLSINTVSANAENYNCSVEAFTTAINPLSGSEVPNYAVSVSTIKLGNNIIYTTGGGGVIPRNTLFFKLNRNVPDGDLKRFSGTISIKVNAMNATALTEAPYTDGT